MIDTMFSCCNTRTMNEECKYVWESRRGIYRVVIDTPVYSKETKRTTHHYETVGKACEKGEVR